MDFSILSTLLRIFIIFTLIPLVVAALAYLLIPPRHQQTPKVASADGQETGQPGPAP